MTTKQHIWITYEDALSAVKEKNVLGHNKIQPTTENQWKALALEEMQAIKARRKTQGFALISESFMEIIMEKE